MFHTHFLNGPFMACFFFILSLQLLVNKNADEWTRTADLCYLLIYQLSQNHWAQQIYIFTSKYFYNSGPRTAASFPLLFSKSNILLLDDHSKNRSKSWFTRCTTDECTVKAFTCSHRGGQISLRPVSIFNFSIQVLNMILSTIYLIEAGSNCNTFQ